MKTTLTQWFCIAFLLFACHGYGQYKVLWDGELVLVGPKNVSAFHPDQSQYYIQKYDEVLELLAEEKRILEYEMDSLKTSKKILGKKKRYYERKQLEKVRLEIIKEEKMVFVFMTMWDRHEVNEQNEIFTDQYDESKCYDLITDHRVYSPSEYVLSSPDEGNYVNWDEISELMTIPETKRVCPNDFVKSNRGNQCLNAVNFRDQKHMSRNIRVQRRSDGSALNIAGFKVINCTTSDSMIR